ncbi:MAG: CAP domain-containing protein [Planctomycetes bacterium]|nr:CAP domain-containing protein [Planctomycetota bacterium]
MKFAWLLLAAPFVLVQETPEAVEARAHALEGQGELALARDLLLRASLARDPGPARDADVDAARALGLRLDLRKEIITARPLDERVFAELGIEQANAAGLVVSGERRAWKDVGLELFGRAAAAARASKAARCGLVLERLARGGPKEQESALVELGRMLEKGEVEPHDASAAVARARGEALPARGYVFCKGEWIDADRLASAEHVASIEALGVAFELAPASEREAKLAVLDGQAQEGRARADLGLETRWKRAAAAILQDPGFGMLSALATEHAELEARRKHALELIFDEQTYFYPYNPPECPPEKARLYAGVQQEVDKRVAAVRESWKSARRARLSAKQRSAVEELAWNAATQKRRKLAFEWPAELPDWVRFLDTQADACSLASFACSASERARLVQDERVSAFNANLLAVKESDKLAAANNEERSELALTNDYRRMLGRAQLAWNRKLQLSAQKHSDYQSLTGDFGHFEKDPARKSPFDRMRAEGYKGGGGENCHMGDSGPQGAHEGWIHSSGHHRQVLSESAHELGVAISGPYWTQNFGNGNEWSASPAPSAPRR